MPAARHATYSPCVAAPPLANAMYPHPPGPAELDPVAVMANDLRRVQRLDRGRRVGKAMMYLPICMVSLLAGVAFSVLPWGITRGPGGTVGLAPWAISLTTALSTGVLLSLPAAVIGALVRVVFGESLRTFADRHAARWTLPLPPPRRGEVLGSWRVAELSPRGLRLVRWVIPPLLWWPVVWGMGSMTAVCLPGLVVMVLRGGAGGLVLGVPLAIGWVAIALAVSHHRGITLRPAPAGGAELELWERWHPLLPRRRRRVPLRAEAAALADGTWVVATARDGTAVRVGELTAGRLGHWEARRLAAAMDSLARHFGRPTAAARGAGPEE